MSDQPEMSRVEITGLLRQWRGGDEAALHDLIPLVYGHLLRMAERHLAREGDGHTLTTAALVNETYLELRGQAAVDWHDRVHFFAIASRTMRRVLIWHARKRQAEKRGGGRLVTLDSQAVQQVAARTADASDLLALDDALQRLEAIDARLCRVVECRHFGGLSVAETAEALGISPATVKRDWQAAKAWLRVELMESEG